MSLGHVPEPALYALAAAVGGLAVGVVYQHRSADPDYRQAVGIAFGIAVGTALGHLLLGG